VLRSARALEAYGPDFQYGHYVAIRSTLGLALGALGVGAVVALAQLGPTRELLLRVRKSGEGPSAQQRAKGRFQVTFVAKTPTKTLVTRVSGGDPGYTETAKMVSEVRALSGAGSGDPPGSGRRAHPRRGPGRRPARAPREGRDSLRGPGRVTPR
jgi:short subunit dehydrogenase-like uncharacterized protein